MQTTTNKRFFVSGIGTGVGKTVAAAVLTEKLQADYWKPIQAGELDNSDTMTVKSLISNTKTHFWTEAYALQTPASPHYAAQLDGIELDIQKIQLPQTDNHLIVEGAGGLLVPLNSTTLIIDLIAQLGLEVILVSRNYLGSINHTLLSIEALKHRQIHIYGIIFNGIKNPASEDFILNYTQIPCLGHISEGTIDPTFIRQNTYNIAL